MQKKSSIFGLLMILLLLVSYACSHSVWNDLPKTVANFIDFYYPGSEIKGYTVVGDKQTVTLDHSAVLVFDSKNEWTEIDGRGVVLPAMLIEDQLPSMLYKYLLETEAVHGVYKLTRTPTEILVKLSTNTIKYNRNDGSVSYMIDR